MSRASASCTYGHDRRSAFGYKSGCVDPAGHAWETEYGDPDNETDFKYLMTYSPLHNVRVPAGSHQYPATMLTTGRQLLSYAFN